MVTVSFDLEFWHLNIGGIKIAGKYAKKYDHFLYERKLNFFLNGVLISRQFGKKCDSRSQKQAGVVLPHF